MVTTMTGTVIEMGVAVRKSAACIVVQVPAPSPWPRPPRTVPQDATQLPPRGRVSAPSSLTRLLSSLLVGADFGQP